MENQRLFLLIALGFVVMLLFQTWQEDYGAKPQPASPIGQSAAADGGVPTATAPRTDDVPSASAIPSQASVTPTLETASGLKSQQRIKVKTDTFNIEIDTFGGDIRIAELRQYTVSIDNPEPLRLLSDSDAKVYIAQSGFAMASGQGPDHTSIYRADQNEYQLADGQDKLEVNLYWQGDDGVKVTKTFIFYRGRHDVDVIYRVENSSQQPWQASQYRQIQRTAVESSRGLGLVYTYTGAGIYTPENHFEKIDFSDMEDEKLNLDSIQGGWVSMIQHYFISAWVPPADEKDTIYSLHRKGRYYIGIKSSLLELQAGEQGEYRSILYIGPKLQKQLEKLAPGLELTVDYGILTIISKPLFWFLGLLHQMTGNWGWAIILLTITIKAAFFKLSETSYRSMARLRKLTPKFTAIKERYGDDKQRMQQAMMEMYKKEKVNPMGGCLPILVQMPVFIALYWVLSESVEMRQAPWILWIQDLSVADPFYVLPVLWGVTMFASQRLNPQPPDPLQAKIMMAMPIVFTFLFLLFPAGLVLYWVVNQILSVAQQWVITKRVEQGK